jgi:hypothetical protein
MDAFEQKIFLTILDKGLLALILGVAGGLIKWLLQIHAANKAILGETAQSRAAACAALWEATEPFRATDPPENIPDVIASAQTALTSKYFEGGNAMYLSRKATLLFNRARKELQYQVEKSDPDWQAIQSKFSAFRTQLKVEVGCYSWLDRYRKVY